MTEQEKILRILQKSPKGISSKKLCEISRSKNIPAIIHHLKKHNWKIDAERLKNGTRIYKLNGKTSEKQVRKYMTINRF